MVARWLTVVGLGCDDLAALALLRTFAADFGSARFRIHANVFDAREHATPCAVLDALRGDANGMPQSTADASVFVGVTTLPGFKSALWSTLDESFTAAYDFVWLKDSDVYADPHLFLLGEVEHWMKRTGASVTQPTILPHDGRSKSHGWWTPFRSAFHASCVAQSSPIIEQMTPIFARPAFDAFRRYLALVPPPLLRTDSGDFGLETLWCGLPLLPASRTSRLGSISSGMTGGSGDGTSPGCVILHHVSVVHMDSKTIRKHTPRTLPSSSSSSSVATHMHTTTFPDNATLARGLRNYLIARWPHAMNASGPPGDVHHRLHPTRCWGVSERARTRSMNASIPMSIPIAQRRAASSSASAARVSDGRAAVGSRRSGREYAGPVAF